MDKAAGMSIRKMWNYCIFQSSRYRGMKYIIVLGALSAASVSYINSFLYAGILDLLLAKQYSAAKEQILILVVTVVLVSLTARACELMFRHYTEPSALETKKKTAQKTFLMEYEELEKEGVIESVPGRGFYVCEQKNDHLREKQMMNIEKRMSDILEECVNAGMTLEDVIDMVRVLGEK